MTTEELMRPPHPDHELGDGWYWHVAVDHDWTTTKSSPSTRCRRRGCDHPPVAWLNRGYRGRPSWWAYCADHMYGRWVEDGVVKHWVVRPVA